MSAPDVDTPTFSTRFDILTWPMPVSKIAQRRVQMPYVFGEKLVDSACTRMISERGKVNVTTLRGQGVDE